MNKGNLFQLIQVYSIFAYPWSYEIAIDVSSNLMLVLFVLSWVYVTINTN